MDLAPNATPEALIKQGNPVTPSTPEDAQQLLRTEEAKYAALVNLADIKLE